MSARLLMWRKAAGNLWAGPTVGRITPAIVVRLSFCHSDVSEQDDLHCLWTWVVRQSGNTLVCLHFSLKKKAWNNCNHKLFRNKSGILGIGTMGALKLVFRTSRASVYKKLTDQWSPFLILPLITQQWFLKGDSSVPARPADKFTKNSTAFLNKVDAELLPPPPLADSLCCSVRTL